MTAVEWLEDCLTEQHPNGSFVWNTRADLEALFKQAKEMEKQQGYSEEEVIQLVSDWTDYRMSEDAKSKVTFKKWFEQFKNR